jgi:hypothetical protein
MVALRIEDDPTPGEGLVIYAAHRKDRALELFPIEVDRRKFLAFCFNEQLYPTKRADWSDVALGPAGRWLLDRLRQRLAGA